MKLINVEPKDNYILRIFLDNDSIVDFNIKADELIATGDLKAMQGEMSRVLMCFTYRFDFEIRRVI